MIKTTAKKKTTVKKKTAAKKKTVAKKKTIAKKKTAVKKKAAAKKAAVRAKVAAPAGMYARGPLPDRIQVPAGYRREGTLIVPAALSKPVPTSKLKRGFDKARKEIGSMISEVATIMTDDYRISEIQLTLSFSADGKFMGIGIGGAATVAVTIRPSD